MVFTNEANNVPAFTDSDLKRLKRDIEIGGVMWKSPFMISLLARLEASEQVAKNARELIVSIKLGTDTPFEIDEVTRSLEAWLRSKGEGV